VHAQLDALQPMLRRLLGASVSVAIDAGARDDRVFMDPGQFSRVLLNLAANARDAMPDGGTIRIATTLESDASGPVLCLAFADTGTGMTPDVRARVFEPFFTTKGPARGTGLGLSVVHDIVAESGGTIGLDSEPGRGTRFEIRWPLATNGPVSTTANQVTQADVRHTVLVVEDREELRTLVVRVLSGAGYHVLSATDGSDGLAMLQAPGLHVAAVVSDVMMPRVSGPSLLTQARQAGLSTPFLFITGQADEALAAGGARLLPKPFTPTQLIDAVGAVIRRA
jgi:CheY-like chemotaxis protein